MFSTKSFKIGGALDAIPSVSRRRTRARHRPSVQVRNPENVPCRGRMTRRVTNGKTPEHVRLNRALYCGLAFGIIGGAIALFMTGTGIKTGPWTTSGLLIAACLACFGAFAGYYSARR